jgi:hypothetical protein
VAIANLACHRDGKKVSDLLSDLDTAAIEQPLRATMLMLGKLTREHSLDTDDIRAFSLRALRADRSRMRSRSVSC